MIITFSGWRGTKTSACEIEIGEAAADILCRLFVYYPDARYRVADCKTGFDAAIKRLWNTQRNRTGWYHPQVWGRRSLDGTWRAEWSRHRSAAGPIRNFDMLRGDGTDDEARGFTDLLVAMPEPGRRKPHSGTHDCLDAAGELGITSITVPLRPARQPFGTFDRMPMFPLPTPSTSGR